MSRIWAHRGASREAPENTMPAFELAVSQGADGIEIDVMRTRDKVLVVTHDESCRRLTGQKGMVREKDFSELKKMNYAWHFPDYPYQSIPTLDEVLELVGNAGVELNIELKNGHYFDEGLEEAVIDKVIEHGLVKKVILSSFNHYSMRDAARLASRKAPGIKCGLLYSSCLADPWHYAKKLDVQAVHPLYSNLQLAGFVDNCHEAGLAVNAWTIDNPEHIAMALQLGVDAVITNVPAQALAIRDDLNEQSRQN